MLVNARCLVDESEWSELRWEHIIAQKWLQCMGRLVHYHPVTVTVNRITQSYCAICCYSTGLTVVYAVHLSAQNFGNIFVTVIKSGTLQNKAYECFSDNIIKVICEER
jgi:hypothetical protein